MKAITRRNLGHSVAVIALITVVGCGRNEGEAALTRAPAKLTQTVNVEADDTDSAVDESEATNAVDAVVARADEVAAAAKASDSVVAGIVVTNAADAALVKELDAGVATLADDIAEEKGVASSRVLDAISKLSDWRLRSLYGERLMNAALSTRFERVGERVAQEYKDDRIRRIETFRRTFRAYGILEMVANNSCLRDIHSSKSVQDRWRLAFAYHERMKEEYDRLKQEDESYEKALRNLLDGWDKMLEDHYEIYMHLRRAPLPPEETAWFKRRFEEVVGRPPVVKSWEDMVKEREEPDAAAPEPLPDDAAPSPLPETDASES